MKRVKVQSHKDLRAEMKAVASGRKRAGVDAAIPSVNSVDMLIRLLTPENRALMAILRDQKPQSIARLAELTGRAAPNLTRTLGKLEAAGLVRMRTADRRKIPVPAVQRLRLEIDLFSTNDQLEMM